MPTTFKIRSVSKMFLAGAALLAGAAGAAAGGHPVTVVELFTSQGCSSCPPANANLTRLSGEPGVLTLSLSVTYWDRLGWKDTFGKPEFTARQVAYEAPLGNSGPFTPQVVVNGRADVVGNELAPLRALIRAGSRPATPALGLDAGSVTVAGGEAPAGGADVWLVRYDPRTLRVAVGRGENTGRTLPHTHVVRRLERLGTWRGKAVTLALPHREAGLQTAVLVQAPHGGPILSAVRE